MVGVGRDALLALAMSDTRYYAPGSVKEDWPQ